MISMSTRSPVTENVHEAVRRPMRIRSDLSGSIPERSSSRTGMSLSRSHSAASPAASTSCAW